jgi:hypothetical protein
LYPFVGIYCSRGIYLPFDFFTFRVWEALLVDELKPIIAAPFYPNQHIIKDEVGDIVPHTEKEAIKHVEWFTDDYGFRKKEKKGPWDIVVIGDSNIAGSSLTQDDMLTEVLEKN